MSKTRYLLVFVKEKKMDAMGMSSRRVATVPKLGKRVSLCHSD